MTLKYESEILFDLMKRDGDDAPSDVLPYESELKEKYLNQVVGAYPKVQDYRPEWLYYNLYHHLPSDFPVESVENVTSASFYNVVPYAYKSAILKGQTLVNISSLSGEITLAPGSAQFSDSSLIKSSTIYTVSFNCSSAPSTGSIEVRQINGSSALKMDNKSVVQGYNQFIVLTHSSEVTRFRFKNDSASTTDFIFNNLMILEGDYTNVDIPYFEGMKSVQMPVLTTSNEDGTKTNILTVNEDVTLRGIGDVQDTLDCLTGEVVERIGEIVLDGSQPLAEIGTLDNTYGVRYVFTADVKTGRSLICDKLTPVVSAWSTFTTTDSEVIAIYTNAIAFRINKNKLSDANVESVVEYLKSNPIKVQYPLAKESIKTVDLSCINEQGKSATFRPIEGTMHVNTSSQALPPLLDMSVTVEATTQNLMSFANMVEEEK